MVPIWRLLDAGSASGAWGLLHVALLPYPTIAKQGKYKMNYLLPFPRIKPGFSQQSWKKFCVEKFDFIKIVFMQNMS